MKILTAIFSLLLLLGNAAFAQDENSLLWKIEGGDAEGSSYLFGTYHLVGSDYLESHQKVKTAYENSSRVVVEMVVDSSKLMQVAMVGMMPGKSLKNMIDSTDYNLVKEEIQRVLGYDVAMFDNMKPMTISVMYAVAMAQESTPEDFNFTGQPIDMYFATDGKKKGKEVVPLETMLEQAKMLYDSIPLEEQAETLVEMVKEKELGEDMTEEILKAYQEEKLNEMWRYAESLEDSYGDISMLVDNRNVRWIEKLAPLLMKGDVFIAVGALHLPGDQGLINLLREEGYTLTPVH